MLSIPPRLLPILLLTCSNVFMTFAWYGSNSRISRSGW